MSILQGLLSGDLLLSVSSDDISVEICSAEKHEDVDSGQKYNMLIFQGKFLHNITGDSDILGQIQIGDHFELHVKRFPVYNS